MELALEEELNMNMGKWKYITDEDKKEPGQKRLLVFLLIIVVDTAEANPVAICFELLRTGFVPRRESAL